jgi:hypothetical protein
MTDKRILLLLLFSILIWSCQKTDPEIPGTTTGDQDTLPGRQIEQTDATGVADEIVRYWKGPEINDEEYLQVTEDMDSLWHVYYVYRRADGEETSVRPIPHLIIPKQEGKTIRFFITH